MPIAHSGSWAIAVVAGVMPGGTLQASCSSHTAKVCPAARSDALSPMQMMAIKPARQAAVAFAATIALVSPCRRRRSEWPTMTAEAPASFSMSALISPV